MWTARVNARSCVRPVSTLDLAVDTSMLHYFDPHCGLAIGHPEAEGAQATAATASV